MQMPKQQLKIQMDQENPPKRGQNSADLQRPTQKAVSLQNGAKKDFLQKGSLPINFCEKKPIPRSGSCIANLSGMQDISPNYLQHICTSGVRCCENMDPERISKQNNCLEILDVSTLYEFCCKFSKSWSDS